MQQVRICSNTAAMDTEIKESISGMERSPARYPCLHCQLLGEVREEEDPGSTLSVTQVHCMHLSSPGLALPSHQVLNHCHDLAFPLQSVSQLQTHGLVQSQLKNLERFLITSLSFQSNSPQKSILFLEFEF